VPVLVERDLLNETALPALAQVDQELDAMSGEHNASLWHAEALAERPEWRRVWELARSVLILLA
jgi:hypothetical protein